VINLLRNSAASRKFVSQLLRFSLSIAVLSFVYSSALSGGLLVEWQSLDFPSEEHAAKILDIGYVQTQSGNIYHFTGLDRLVGNWREGVWERVDKITDEQFVVPSPNHCGTFPFLPILKDDFVDSKSACIGTWRWSTAKVAYAIDDFGRVYLWYHDNAEFGGGDIYSSRFAAFWFSTIQMTLFFLGGITSCILGLIVILVVALSSFLRKKVQKHSFKQIQ